MATKDGELSLEEEFPSDGEFPHKHNLLLLKIREAAREYRRKKDYMKCLENRVKWLENQNRMLIEELKSRKELYTSEM